MSDLKDQAKQAIDYVEQGYGEAQQKVGGFFQSKWNVVILAGVAAALLILLLKAVL